MAGELQNPIEVPVQMDVCGYRVTLSFYSWPFRIQPFLRDDESLSYLKSVMTFFFFKSSLRPAKTLTETVFGSNINFKKFVNSIWISHGGLFFYPLLWGAGDN